MKCGPIFGELLPTMASILGPMIMCKLCKENEGNFDCVCWFSWLVEWSLEISFEILSIDSIFVVGHALVRARVHLPGRVYFEFTFDLHIFASAHFPLIDLNDLS